MTTLAPPPVQPGPPAGKPRMSAGRRAMIVIGSILALLVVFGVIGLVIGGTSAAAPAPPAAAPNWNSAPSASSIVSQDGYTGITKLSGNTALDSVVLWAAMGTDNNGNYEIVIVDSAVGADSAFASQIDSETQAAGTSTGMTVSIDTSNSAWHIIRATGDSAEVNAFSSALDEDNI
jgi:hypothetical protein